MPQLEPESMSMVGLNLFTQLCHLTRIANASLDNPLTEDKVQVIYVKLSVYPFRIFKNVLNLKYDFVTSVNNVVFLILSR